MEYTREPEIYYLHLYSTRYDIYDPSIDAERPPRENKCIASIAISPGVEFFADVYNHYEPEILIQGTVTRRKTSFEGAFSILVQDCGLALEHEQTARVQKNVLIPFSFGNDEFYFAISDSGDPYSLDYKLK